MSNWLVYGADMRWMLITVVCVAGCGLVPEGPQVATEGDVVVSDAPGAQRPETRPDEAVESAPDMSIGTLGRTVASLGDASEPGLWLRTPLVGATRQGRVFYAATDQSAAVTLIPIEGPATAGSRMSLAAMQALGASPADLIDVDVFGF